MLKLTFFALAFTLAACSRPVAEVQPSSGRVPGNTASRGKTSILDVFGQWDVVSFEGYIPGRRYGSIRNAFADFDEKGVRLRIECNYSQVSGFVQAGWFVAMPGSRPQTEMACGKEREDRDSRYFSFFIRSPRIEVLGSSRLRLTTGESVLNLERPAQRRLSFVPKAEAIQGTWRMEDLTRYEPDGGFSGIGLSELPGNIIIKGNRLSYDLCPTYDLTFVYAADGRLMDEGMSPFSQRIDCSSLEVREYKAPALPSAVEILRLVHANPWIEELGDGRLLIANEQFGLTLSRVSDRR